VVPEEVLVAWFRRRARSGALGASVDRSQYRADLEYLEQFARSRRGVEGYLEPRTTVTQTTLMLIAHDGEWTRRRVPDPHAAFQFGSRIGIPIYEVRLVGYPKRMREYNARRKAAGA
jgi:hypothetical protein